MTPDFLAVGHIVKDISADGWRPGGSVSYATLQASRLGLRTAAVTACGPDVEPVKALPWAEWAVVPSAKTTTFENVYRESGRNQRVLANASPISIEAIPAEWRSAPIVLLGPVAGEIAIEPSLLRPPNGILGLCAQGWLREISRSGVRPIKTTINQQAAHRYATVRVVVREQRPTILGSGPGARDRQQFWIELQRR